MKALDNYLDRDGNLEIGTLTVYKLDKQKDIEFNIDSQFGTKFLTYDETEILIEFLTKQLK